jgi:hypothetical protein
LQAKFLKTQAYEKKL